MDRPIKLVAKKLKPKKNNFFNVHIFFCTCGISAISIESPVASLTTLPSSRTIFPGPDKNATFPDRLPSDSTILPLMTALVFGFSNLSVAINCSSSMTSEVLRNIKE